MPQGLLYGFHPGHQHFTRVVPPVPNESVGNFVGSFIARAEEAAENALYGLVAELRKGIQQFSSKAKRVLLSQDILVVLEPQMVAIGLLSSDDMDFYVCTSWCRFEL